MDISLTPNSSKGSTHRQGYAGCQLINSLYEARLSGATKGVDEMALDELAVDEMAVDDLTPHQQQMAVLLSDKS